MSFVRTVVTNSDPPDNRSSTRAVDASVPPVTTATTDSETGCCGSTPAAIDNLDDANLGLVLDPVCGMQVDPSSAAATHAYRGASYHFCSPRCGERFDADPYFFVSGRHRQQQREAADSTAQYTCPMDPEVIQEGPGTCPVCGMALEPMDGIADGPNEELIDFTRRFVISALCAVPMLILTMGPMVGLPIREWLGEPTSRWLELLLTLPVIGWAAWPILQRGWSSLLSRNFNMWTLILLGVGAAFVYSVAALLLPGWFPASLQHHGHVPLYFEAAVIIITLVFLGQVLELRARERTGDAIRALLQLAPDTAQRVTPDGDEYAAPLANIMVDDVLRLRAGEAVPVDGVVLEGTSTVDESLLTGEALPVAKQVGDNLTAGTVNGSGSLLMRADGVGNNTVLARIVSMVAGAQRTRAPVQALADRVASWFVPAVVSVALLAFVLWWWLGPTPALGFAVTAAISVLIIACPCALGLATPMSIMTATGRGARDGVLIKEADALQQMAQVDTLVVDKTGTLTAGRPQVTGVELLRPDIANEERVLQWAASLEQGATHPLAEAVLVAASERHLPLLGLSDFESVTGKGITGTLTAVASADAVEVPELWLGNRALLEHMQVSPELLEAAISKAGKWEREGVTSVYLASAVGPLAVIGIHDPVKPDAAATIDALHAAGLRIVMATGDTQVTANHVAEQLGIDVVHAALLPEQKLALVQQLQSEGASVAMAGDGVNDAPALAAADVSIAMGPGADVAVESAGMTLLHGQLDGIVKARKLSQATMRNIRQNLFFAFAYNAIGVPVAAGILYPWTGWLLSPMLAAAAMSLSSVSVITNALRLRSFKW